MKSRIALIGFVSLFFSISLFAQIPINNEPVKSYLASPVTLTLLNEATGKSATVSSGICDPFGVTMQSNFRHEGDWLAWHLDFDGTKPAAGYTFTFDFPVLDKATHLFTPSEKGVVDLAMQPTCKPAAYGTIVFGSAFCYVLPLVSVFDAKNDTALTIALRADENTPHLQIEWIDGKILRFTLKHRGIGKDRKSPLTFLFTTHPADDRCVIAAYAKKFPQWFEPVMPPGKIDGAFWYHHILRRPDPEELKRQNVRYLWSSFWFTHLGDYLPKETEWFPYTYSERSIFPIAGEKMTDERINTFIGELRKENIGLFAYFNVTEYGGKGGEGGDPAEANRILRERFADALVKNLKGDAIGTWEGAMAMNANEKYSLWPFLKEQIERHLARLPDFEGFLIDRLDWASFLDYAHDDGLTMVGEKPAENLALSIMDAVDRVCHMAHEKRKRVYVNQFTRIEPVKNSDGYCHEMDFLPIRYLSPFKPAAAWFHQQPYARVADLLRHEAQLKKRLQIALFPQLIAHEFPVSQQYPDPVAADCNEMFAPLFAPFVGKRQVLLPHCISASGDNDCNLFTEENGRYLVPLTSRSKFLTLGDRKTEPVTVTIAVPDAQELSWAHVIPIVEKPYRATIEMKNGQASVSLAKHGAASLLIVGKGNEPPLSDTDFARLAEVCNQRFSKTVPGKSFDTKPAPQGKIKSAILSLSGQHFYHAGLSAVSINGVECGTFAADSGEIVCHTLPLTEEMTVCVTAADEGTWWFPKKARLIVELEDGSIHVAQWNRTDGIEPNSTPIKQVFNLRWYDRTISVATAAFLGNDTVSQGEKAKTLGKKYTRLAENPNPAGLLKDKMELTIAGTSYLWARQTEDLRVFTGKAACWFALPKLSGEVVPVDEKPYQFTIYCLDFDRIGRAYSIRITDSFGKILDVRPVSLDETKQGVYLTWDITGPVNFEIELAEGSRHDANVTISGVFVD